MSWATGADVVALTGKPADEEKIQIAQAHIELFIGRTEALGSAEMNARDLEWLKRAVAYQATWLEGQADIDTRLNLTQMAQDGQQATFQGDALVLAPLAKLAIGKLSWMGRNRSISVEPFCPTIVARYPVGGPVIDYDFERWRRL
jgi:hypothetical protein